MPSPIGGVHIYDHIFVLWNHMYVAHAFEPFPNSPHAEGILLWKLPQCQFAVNVVGYYWFTIRPVTSDELPSAVKTLIKVTASPSAILFDARRPAPFALFLFIKWYFQHRKVIGIQITASISAYFFLQLDSRIAFSACWKAFKAYNTLTQCSIQPISAYFLA